MTGRVVLLAVDDSDACEGAVKFTVEQMHQGGDEYHVVHVIPRLQLSSQYGAPSIDFLPQQDSTAYEALLQRAQDFLAARVVTHLGDVDPPPMLHLIKSETDTDSIGAVICRKAEELGAGLVVLSARQNSRLHDFFVGSVSGYCLEHCAAPLLIHS
ncbi:hypothetical protein ACKKBG_A33920 [Auxenochlorella protothecoides x Auxenochlorella symbiontica]|uniref:UspA domain-containing protein n=1 Tax=Auxenochlorella protothecoides TaxID=3075 RepID=A0A087SIV7_AUXPR|nr:hypothetical protein F751_2503 [Auxenochlorella protothecoides]KFM25661.1 hypothetical protein F751_2503 [Auxenochlorella protothecoides]RMZ57443.1 hypothetical protein APUTEX25_004277 [Auxenochlorella protothecoides]|eukprot:RMZ57443.1 hypothetical protein APUTEX25_004277 [Auxenochlorella protothecoides]